MHLCTPKWQVFLPLGSFSRRKGTLLGGGHAAALLTLKIHWFDTLTMKQWEIMINNDV